MTTQTYAIGIDLGTTTLSLAFISPQSLHQGMGPPHPETFLIPQRQDERLMVTAKTLASLIYIPQKAMAKKLLAAGQDPLIFGPMAEQAAFFEPDRVVSQAKSWLVHPYINPRNKILPCQSQSVLGVDQYSPLEAQSAYLAYLAKAWNEAYPYALFKNQKITITVPASFDPKAVNLTKEAALLAGYPEDVDFVEEPHSAFLSWIQEEPLPIDSQVLVLDMGGGTTDMSLFEKQESGFRRMATGPHLLLGGENLDLALALWAEAKIMDQKKLPNLFWRELLAQSTKLKKEALSHTSKTVPLSFHLQSPSAKLFHKHSSYHLSCQSGEVQDLLLEGFFPKDMSYDLKEWDSSHALEDLGLPYPKDPRVTAHVWAFLKACQKPITHVLFHGGSLIPDLFCVRLLESIELWQQGVAPKALRHPHMELGVSLGAAIYSARTLDSRQVKNIDSLSSGGLNRALYLALDQKHQYLCIAPKGLEVEKPIYLEVPGLKVNLNTRCSFSLWAQGNKTPDHKLGSIIHDETLTFVSHVQGFFQSAQEGSIPQACLIRACLLSSRVLDFKCQVGDESWSLDFGFGSVSSLKTAYPREGFPDPKPDLSATAYLKFLEEHLGTSKQNWTLKELRAIWQWVFDHPKYFSEAVRYNLLGYTLRPGFGDKDDDLRCQTLEKLLARGGPQDRSSSEVWSQWWILWRRIASGLSQKSQEELFDRHLPSLRGQTVSTGEIYTLCGSLEKISARKKITLGNLMLDQLTEKRTPFPEQKIWVLSRISNPRPLGEDFSQMIPRSQVEEWIQHLYGLVQLPQEHLTGSWIHFLVQVGRLMGHRTWEISQERRVEVLALLNRLKAPKERVEPLLTWSPLSSSEKARLLGDDLPSGFTFHGA